MSIRATLPGPSHLGSHLQARGEAVVLRLPVSAVPAPGPARALVGFTGYEEKFVLDGVVERVEQRQGSAVIELSVDRGNRELGALLDYAASDPKAPRRAPRYPLGALVELVETAGTRTALVRDVSLSGCFLQLPGPRLPGVGDRVELRPRGGVPVEGEVVRTAAASPRGVGVRFVPCGPGQLQVRSWVLGAVG